MSRLDNRTNMRQTAVTCTHTDVITIVY